MTSHPAHFLKLFQTSRGLVSVRDPPALPGRHAEFDSSGIEMEKTIA